MQTRQNAWTKNVLIHQIENQTYQKTIINQNNFEQTIPPKVQNRATLSLKDDYTFYLLELSDEHSEYQLEQAILKNIRKFLNKLKHFFFRHPKN